MVSFIIEQGGQIKEAFQYERPLLSQSYQALETYAHANYGPDAIVRTMTKDEEASYMLHGPSGVGLDPLPSRSDQ
jgi:hypothetical protein